MEQAKNPRPEVVAANDRVQPPGQQTRGMVREQAFAGDDRWVGYVHSDPGEWSGWHHHGETDTYFYVLQGGVDFEFGVAGDTTEVGTGEFCHVPGGLVHRERPHPGQRAELVLVRIGSGPTVINVADPRTSG